MVLDNMKVKVYAFCLLFMIFFVYVFLRKCEQNLKHCKFKLYKYRYINEIKRLRSYASYILQILVLSTLK